MRAGVAVGVGASVSRRDEGRPRAHLHADDSRGDRHDAGVRPARRRSLARLRRLRVQGTRHQDQPCTGPRRAATAR